VRWGDGEIGARSWEIARSFQPTIPKDYVFFRWHARQPRSLARPQQQKQQQQVECSLSSLLGISTSGCMNAHAHSGREGCLIGGIPIFNLRSSKPQSALTGGCPAAQGAGQGRRVVWWARDSVQGWRGTPASLTRQRTVGILSAVRALSVHLGQGAVSPRMLTGLGQQTRPPALSSHKPQGRPRRDTQTHPPPFALLTPPHLADTIWLKDGYLPRDGG
jgi:hypothetical protein